jgi:ATP-binding cassette, subfamily C, bacterial exporter for protease/lipase
MNPVQRSAPQAPLRDAVRDQRKLFIQAGWLSVATGLLALTPSWYMFEVYGRVLDSRNAYTLLMLSLMVLGVYVVLELLELVRARILDNAGERIEHRLRARLFDAAFDANLRRQPGGNTQVFNDLRTLREFVSGPPVTAVLDTPAAVVCLALLFAINPWLGVLALVGAGLQAVLALLTEKRTMPLLTKAMQASIQAQNYAGGALRNAQVIESMGMMRNLHARWARLQRQFLSRQAEASDYGGITSAAAKLIQMMQGSILLGAAALLMLRNDLWGGAGMMIVASILGTRVLNPLAQLVGSWRLVVNVRDAATRLELVLNRHNPAAEGMPLPAPKGLLQVENVVAGAPGNQAPILRGINFAARPGEVVAVIGPSAAGKSTLCRLLVGIWPAAAGKVRLDGADVYGWNKAELGPHIGYLPQTVELFDGTVAENVARFGDVDLEAVRAAIAAVGLTDTVEALPEGFDTRIGDEGAVLSGGQRQRLGLARAIYRNPNFLVLDEPNSSLDEAGEKGLVQLLQALKQRGATCIVITHRTTLLGAADKLLILNDGQVSAFGPRDDVLAALKKANDQARAQLEARQAAGARPAGSAA